MFHAPNGNRAQTQIHNVRNNGQEQQSSNEGYKLSKAKKNKGHNMRTCFVSLFFFTSFLLFLCVISGFSCILLQYFAFVCLRTIKLAPLCHIYVQILLNEIKMKIHPRSNPPVWPSFFLSCACKTFYAQKDSSGEYFERTNSLLCLNYIFS